MIELGMFRPLLLASIASFIGWALSRELTKKMSSSSKRLARFAGFEDPLEDIEFGGQKHKIRLLFAHYGIDVAGREGLAMWGLRVGAGVVMFLCLSLVGLPTLARYAGFGAGLLLANGLVAGRWTRMRAEIEKEIPAFLTRLSTIIQARENILVALGETAKGLNREKPLKPWLERLISDLNRKGRSALEDHKGEAMVISPSLGIVVFLIGRAWDTGGVGYAAALGISAENLQKALSGRLLGIAKSRGLIGSANVVVAMTVFVTAYMVRNPDTQAQMGAPIMQIGYAVIVLVMTGAYMLINQMVEDLMK
jgi:hypothetical protein